MGGVRECRVCGEIRPIHAREMCDRDYKKWLRREHKKGEVRRHVRAEDLIEDLKDFTFSRSDIESRLGMKWNTVYVALRRAERYDLIQKVQKASE